MTTLKRYAFADEAGANMDEQIAAMLRNRLDGLEIRNVNGANVSDISPIQAKEIHQKLQDAGLKVWSIGSPIGKIDIEQGNFAAEKEKLRRTLETAAILEASNIRIFSFYIPAGKTPVDERNRVMEQLGQLVDIASGSCITLCHENEKGIYGDTADRCLDIFQTFPSIRGVFDPANFVQCNQDTMQAWNLLHSFIHYLHIKDALADGNVVPAGEGIGHVQEILEAFRAQEGWAVTIEPHLKTFSGLSALERQGEKSGIGLYTYESSDAAFDAACAALEKLL